MRTDTPRPSGASTKEAASVLAIVVTHRGRDWIRDCLVGLANQTYSRLSVLVVDDASPDFRVPPHLRRVVKRHLQRLGSDRWGFLRTPRPLGFGGAINWALSRVRTEVDLLLFVHDDAAVDETSVERMVARISAEDDVAIVGPKIVSWEDEQRLEEVGMAIDRFGYPYKGLEEDEIDLGQHDTPNEVFYVTSTCMLIRHEVFRSLRGFDARMRAFSEDLDLCWRARVAGHRVRVEPTATARHAIALATGQRVSKFGPPRYFIRRNRLRTIAKNASGIRLVVLLPQFVLLAFAEMIGFIVLRQPREILHLTRALFWNVLHFPQTLRERNRVQRVRRVPDRRLNRLTVRQATRVRFYVTNQADRLEQAWGRRAEIVARQGGLLKAFAGRVRGWPLVAGLATILGLAIGFRHFLWAPAEASFGELLPFPDHAFGMWGSFFSSWQTTALGSPGPSPPADLLLGVLPIVAFGAEGAAQKLLIGVLGTIAFLGAVRLVAPLVDRPARYVAGFVYLLGGVGYAGIRTGGLAALAFGAAAPFALASLLRITGWVRPPAWKLGREAASLVLAVAVSAAFVPGSLAIYLVAAFALSLGRAALHGSPSGLIRSMAGCALSIAASWALLLPWSATWLAPGGPLARLTGDQTWEAYAATFSGSSMASALLGQAPDVPVLFGLALPLLGVVAVATSAGQRRRVALGLWSIVIVVGIGLAATAGGLVRPIVATPTEAGVLPALAFAGLAGIAVGAFRLDLPRRGLGRIHVLTIGGLALAAFLVAAGVVPSLWRGEWAPGGPAGRASGQTMAQIRSLLEVEALDGREFRALWIGDGWSPGPPSSARPLEDYFVSSPNGLVMNDLFALDAGRGERDLEDVIASVEEGATDGGGSLLGAFNIRFVVLEPGEGVPAWLEQRDLALTRTEPNFLLLENSASLARAGTYSRIPPYVRAVAEADPALTTQDSSVQRNPASRVSPSRHVAQGVSGPGEVFLAESFHPDWRATLNGASLSRIDGGWANAFAIPDEEGTLEVFFERPLREVVLLLVVGLAWIATVGAAFSRRHSASAFRPGGRR